MNVKMVPEGASELLWPKGIKIDTFSPRVNYEKSFVSFEHVHTLNKYTSFGGKITIPCIPVGEDVVIYDY